MPTLIRRRRKQEDGEFPRALRLALALALTFAALGVVFLLANREEKRGAESAAAVDSLRSAASAAEVFLAPEARVATLTSTPAGPPDGRGRAVYDPATGRLVVIFDRLRFGAGERPTLWALAGGEPRFLSEIKANAAGYAVSRAEVPGTSEALDALALSLEPDSARGDRLAPAGPVVLMGVLER